MNLSDNDDRLNARIAAERRENPDHGPATLGFAFMWGVAFWGIVVVALWALFARG